MTQLAKQQSSAGIIKSLPSVSSKEVSIYNAHQTAKKIKDFDSEQDLTLMNSLITKWATYVGIKQPEPTELNSFSNYIKKNFGTFNSFDINECVELLARDELDTDAKHYGSFSMIYITAVLKAYNIHKGQALFKVREKLEKIELEKVVTPSDEERLANFKALLLHAKETVNKKETFYDAGDILYYFFWKNNLVTKPMPKELELDAKNHGEEMFRKKAQANALKQVINDVTFNKLVKEDIVRKYAREYATNIWIKEIDIDALVKNISIKMIKY